MCELLDLAKEKTGLSYYGIAKKLEISTPLMNKWKNNKSKPNGLNSMKLAVMAGITPSEAVRVMEGGYARVSILTMTAIACTAYIILFFKSSLCILCKIKRKLSSDIFGFMRLNKRTVITML